MAAEHVALARRWFDEVWNQRRAETIDELLTAESMCHTEGGTLCGPDGFRSRGYEPFIALLPDLRVTVEGTVGEADEVAVRWVAEGTHTGEAMGLKPTGRRVRFRGITWIRFQAGKMHVGWDCWDVTGLLASLRH